MLKVPIVALSTPLLYLIHQNCSSIPIKQAPQRKSINCDKYLLSKTSTEKNSNTNNNHNNNSKRQESSTRRSPRRSLYSTKEAKTIEKANKIDWIILSNFLFRSFFIVQHSHVHSIRTRIILHGKVASSSSTQTRQKRIKKSR